VRARRGRRRCPTGPHETSSPVRSAGRRKREALPPRRHGPSATITSRRECVSDRLRFADVPPKFTAARDPRAISQAYPTLRSGPGHRVGRDRRGRHEVARASSRSSVAATRSWKGPRGSQGEAGLVDGTLIGGH
jgi:hypothetical protein